MSNTIVVNLKSGDIVAHQQIAMQNNGTKAKSSAVFAKQSVVSPDNGDQKTDAAASQTQNPEDSGASKFQKIYHEIAQSNKIAQRKNGTQNGTESKDTADTPSNEGPIDAVTLIQSLLSPEILKQLGLTGGKDQTSGSDSVTVDGLGQTPALSNLVPAGDSQASAVALIQDALAAISKALNIKLQPGLEDLSLKNPSKEIVDQFAEMITALKGIAGVLDQAVAQNQPVEYKNTVFDVQTAKQVQQTIHQQIFKLEIAFKMVGISGDVAQDVAAKTDTVLQNTNAGIVTAVDPMKLSMPAIHTQQIAGEAISTDEKKVETLLAKLAQSIKKDVEPDKTALMNKIVNATTAVDTSGAAKVAGVSPIDGAVLRKMLKIDGVKAAAEQNKQAALNPEKADLQKQDGTILTSKTLTGQLQQSHVTNDTQTVVSDDLLKIAGNADRTFVAQRVAVPSAGKTIEESIMQQINEKLNVAVKTGITEMRVMLRPESLGEVQLKIRVEGDVVMGKMYVENQQVKHIVEANLQTLKDSLTQHNLQVGSFDVDINHGNGAQQDMRDLANMGTQRKNEDGAESNTEKPDVAINASGLVSGLETGRKFGTNSIEYFA